MNIIYAIFYLYNYCFSILPRSFEDKKIRLFARNKENANIVRRAFEKWCRKHVNPLPLPFPSSQTDTTPIRNGSNSGSNINSQFN